MNTFFQTTDLALAATISLYYPVDCLDYKDKARVVFLFERRDEYIDTLISSYWKGELKVEPKQFFAQLKILKSRIYEER